MRKRAISYPKSSRFHPFFSSLRFRLILLALLAVIPALGLVLYTGFEQRRIATVGAQEEALRLARLISRNQGQLVEEARNFLYMLSKLPQVQWRESTSCSALFADLLQQYPGFLNIAAAEPNGNVSASAIPLTHPVDLSDRSYFQMALQTGNFSIGDYVIGRIIGKPMINFGYPVLNKEGKAVAVVLLGMHLGWLNKFLDEMELPPGSTATVLNHNGVVLAHHPSPEKWVGGTMDDLSLLTKILSQGEGMTEVTDKDGSLRLYAFSPFGGSSWAGNVYVTVGIPKSIAYGRVNAAFHRNLIFLGIIAFFVVLAAWIAGDLLIVQRLSPLFQATDKLTKGDLSARTGLVCGKGELGQLAVTFDHMAESLEKRESERQQAEKALHESEQRYRTLIESSTDAIFMLDKERRIVTCNQAFLKLFGYNSLNEVKGKSTRVIHPSDESFQHFGERAYPILNEKGTFRAERDLVRSDGTIFPVETVVSAIRLPDGSITGYVSIHRDMSRRKRYEKQIQRQSSLLNGINKILLEGLICKTDAEVALKCLSVAQELTGSKFGFIGEVNDRGRFDTIALSDPGWNVCKEPTESAIRLINNMEIRGIWGRVLKDGKSQIVNDPASHPDRVGTPEGHPEIIRFLGVPLTQIGRTIGMIALANKESGYDPSDQEAVEVLSGVFVEALTRKRMEDTLRQSEEASTRLAQENAVIAEVGRIIGSTLNIEEVYEGFAEEVGRLIPFDRITISRATLRNTALQIAHGFGIAVPLHQPGNCFPITGTAAEECLRTRSSLLINVEDEGAVVKRFPGLLPNIQAGIRSMMLIPLISKSEVIGVLHIRSTKLNAYTEKDLRLAERVGDQIAGAIANAELFLNLKLTQDKLNKSENKFHDLFDAAPVGYHELDAHARVVDINRTELEVLGYTKEEMIGHPMWEFVGQKEAARELMLAKLAGNEPPARGLERTFRRKNGTTFPVLIEDRFLHNSEGKITGIRSIIQDISELKRTQDSLRESEEAAKKLAQENAVVAEIGRIISSTLNIEEVYEGFAREVARLISFDRIVIGIVNLRNNTIRITYAAGRDVPGIRPGDCLTLAGMPAEECARTRSNLLIKVEDEEAVLKRFPGLLPNIQAGIRSMILTPLMSKDEVIGTFHVWSAKPNVYTERELRLAERVGHQIAGAVANAELFGQIKQTEGALKKSKELFEKIFVSQRDAIFLLDDRTPPKIVDCNPMSTEMFGYERQEMLGRTMPCLHVNEESHQRFRKDLYPALEKQGYFYVANYEMRRKDGTIFPTERFVIQLKGEKGEPIGRVSVIKDITQRRQAEEKIMASLREKEVLLKEIHHRVKNNLQVISSLLNLQSRYIQDRQALDLFRESQNRVKSMALIHEKLYQSKDLARIDFAEYVRTLSAHLFSSYQRGSNIRLKVSVENVFLSVDAAIPCGLIINELVSNALKHAFPSGSNGEMSVAFEGDGGHRVTLKVKDNGIGFPGDIDFRNTQSLGLQLVNTLTNQLGGTIELDRTEGTEFRITFTT